MNSIQDSDWLEKMKRARLADNQIEKAYRRGAHQALALITNHLQIVDDLAEYKRLMAESVRIVSDMRREQKEIPAFVHELIRKLDQDNNR